MKKTAMNTLCFVFIILLSSSIVAGATYAQTENDLEPMFTQARSHIVNGDYKQALTIYDEILEIAPSNISTLKMKGIVHSNLDQHDKSLKQFFKVLQYKPDDVIALTGMGVGFGNLGEYQASKIYFERALREKPDSVVINNYNEFVENVILKYPYTPTEEPKVKEFVSTIPKSVVPRCRFTATATGIGSTCLDH